MVRFLDKNLLIFICHFFCSSDFLKGALREDFLVREGEWREQQVAHIAQLAKKWAILNHIIRVDSDAKQEESRRKHVQCHKRAAEKAFVSLCKAYNRLHYPGLLDNLKKIPWLDYEKGNNKYNVLPIIASYLTVKSQIAQNIPIPDDEDNFYQTHFCVAYSKKKPIYIPEPTACLVLGDDWITLRYEATAQECVAGYNISMMAHAPWQNMCLVSTVQDEGLRDLVVIGKSASSPIQHIGNHCAGATYLMRYDGCYIAKKTRCRDVFGRDEIQIIDVAKEYTSNVIATINSQHKNRCGRLDLLSLVGSSVVYVDQACGGIYEYDFLRKDCKRLYDHQVNRHSGSFACDSQKGLWMAWQGYNAPTNELTAESGFDLRICAEGIMKSAYLPIAVLGLDPHAKDNKDHFLRPKMLSSDGQYIVVSVEYEDRDETLLLNVQKNKGLSFIDALRYEGIRTPESDK